VPWTDWLSQEELRQFHERYPGLSFKQLAVEAMRQPDYAERFAELGAFVEEYRDDFYMGFLYSPEDFPDPRIPEESEKTCARFIVLALLGGGQADTPPGEAPEDEALAEGLDLGGKGYTDAEMETVVRLCREGRFRARRLEAEGPMSLRSALRMWHWFQPPVRAARWSAEEGLHAGPGFQWVARKTPEGRRWTLVRSG
jgi:hypothetical protein